MVNAARSAFGFQVESPYALRFLRWGGGVEPLRVLPWEAPVAPQGPALVEWRLPDGSRESRAKLYRHQEAFRLQTAGGFSCLIDPRAHTIRVVNGTDTRFWEAGLWGLPALLCFQNRGDFSLHAAAVEVRGGAVLLAASGRCGKSTLALALHNRGYRILSEDLACCRLTPQPVILPGPAILRLRPDMYEGTPPAGTRVVAMRPDRVYLELDDDRRGSGAPVPIRALVLLRESVSNVRLESMTGARALSYLWALSFCLPTDAAVPRRFTELSRLVETTPVWSLHRPLSRARLSETVAAVLETCGS